MINILVKVIGLFHVLFSPRMNLSASDLFSSESVKVGQKQLA